MTAKSIACRGGQSADGNHNIVAAKELYFTEMAQEHPIRVVARRTGLTPHVIRIWEKRYGAVVPRRTSTKRRFYTDEDVERLILLRRATMSGRSIGQVARLSREELLELAKADAVTQHPSMPGTHRPEGRKDDMVDRLVSECLRTVQDLNAKELEACLARAAASLSQPVFLEDFLVR
ncbi:MAG TPA: MerR family transcriptional regulator, partial [Acidobacteriota bacterium]|nr:MerR family transcriptional regulator [Acidobacteriota bacterium]